MEAPWRASPSGSGHELCAHGIAVLLGVHFVDANSLPAPWQAAQLSPSADVLTRAWEAAWIAIVTGEASHRLGSHRIQVSARIGDLDVPGASGNCCESFTWQSMQLFLPTMDVKWISLKLCGLPPKP